MIKSCLPINCAVNKAVALTSQRQRGSVLIRAESRAWEAQVCYQLCWHVLSSAVTARTRQIQRGLPRHERAAVCNTWPSAKVSEPEDQELVGLVGVFFVSVFFLFFFLSLISIGFYRSTCPLTGWLIQQQRMGLWREEKKGCKSLTCKLCFYLLFSHYF